MMQRILFLLTVASSACQTQAVLHRVDSEPRIVEGRGFSHVVIEQSRPGTGSVVHLYVDGDGRPFMGRTHVATDPTPQRSQVLSWMMRDEAPAFYLGRPCYLGMAHRDKCDSRWWTTERYADVVVESMVVAARRVLQGRPVILIGFSGGGKIALHMASRLEGVQGLLTVAANLDTQAWTFHHGYTPLASPGDPVRALQQIEAVPQIHLLGGADRVVPAELLKRLAGRVAQGRFCVIERNRHNCCWDRVLPQLLEGAQAWNCSQVRGVVLRP